MRLTPLSISPSALVVLSDDEITRQFGALTLVDKKKGIYGTADSIIKVLPKTDDKEVAVTNAVQQLAARTQIFVHSPGYILSAQRPEIFLFMERIPMTLGEFPDDPADNENAFFELLIGLFYARRELNFSHFDIHADNLMAVPTRIPQDKTFIIADDFTVTLKNVRFQPKLIDYGKAVVAGVVRPPKSFFVSDVRELSMLFSRRATSPAFGEFLNGILLHFSSRPYPPRQGEPTYDPGSNYAYIERLLREYFPVELIRGHAMTFKQQRFFGLLKGR